MRKAILMGIIGAGCATQAPAPQPTDAARQLGIDHYDVKYSATTLVIDGLDAKDSVIAEATLKLGRFTMEDDGEVVDGRQLDINVNGKSAHHESRGFHQLALPLNGRTAKIRAFLQDPLVAKPLLAWGVGFDARGKALIEQLQPGDKAFEMSCYDPYALAIDSSYPYVSVGACTYESSCANVEDCTQFDRGGGEYGEYVCCLSNGKEAERTCTSPNSSSSCGDTGDKGCAPCWDAPQAGCHTYDGPTYSTMHSCTI